jgi:hypothetical protein
LLGWRGVGVTPKAIIGDATSALPKWAAEVRADDVDLPTAHDGSLPTPKTARIVAAREKRSGDP